MGALNQQSNDHQPARQPAPENAHSFVATSPQTEPAHTESAYSDSDPATAESHILDARTLLALQALSDTALSHLSLETLLPETLERVRTVMQVDNAAILLLDEDTQELVVRAARGPEEDLIGVVRVPYGVGFAGRIASERAPLVVADSPAYPVSNPLLREALTSLLGVPLLAGDRVLGVIHIGSATPRHFTAADTTLLQQVAERVARAVERAQLFAAAESARKLAEQRAAFLSTTLEALGDGLVITDPEGRVLFGNPAYTELIGALAPRDDTNHTNHTNESTADPHRSAGAPPHVPHLDVRDAENNPLAPDQFAFRRVLRGETLSGPTAVDVQARYVNGQEVYLNLTGAPVRDPSGTLLGAVIAVRDVTERRRLEQQALAATQQANERATRLEAIFATVTDGLFVYDESGHIIECNPAATAMLATFAPPEARDESLYERGKRIGGLRDPSGRELAFTEWPQTRIAQGDVLNSVSSEYVCMRRRDGTESYLNVSGAPLRNEHGDIVGSVCLYRDITERWEMGEILQSRTRDLEAANVQLHTLLEVLPVGVAIVDATGKAQLVNDAVRQIWGQNLVISENTEQYSAYKAWHTDTGQPVAPDEWGLMRALASGEVSVGKEYDIETFDGTRKAILDSAAPIRDQSGAITGAVSVVFEITERRQLEQRARDALEAFIAITRTLVEVPQDDDESAADTAHTNQPATDETTAEQSESPSQPREESPIARRLAELTRGILGCSRVSVSAVEGDPPLSRPVTVVGLTPAQERQWWVEQAAQPPQPVGAGLQPDDAERLLAGDALTLDLTKPPYQIPNNYGVTSILAVAMRTQGRVVGQLVLDFQDPGGGPHLFTREEMQVAQAVAQLGAVVLERERLLREREAARAEVLALAEANRRMDEFLSIAGHELRTPITTIKANLQLAERRARQALQVDPPADAPVRNSARAKACGPLEQLLQLLARAAQSVTRQERLVQDLLDISRISAGRLEYRIEPQNLTELAHEIVEEQRLSAPNRRIELEAPAEPLIIAADADRLGQVLTNYLTNAVKYSEATRPVTVTLRRQQDSVRVEVRDQGPGLTPEQQRHIFERFHRVEGIEVVSGSGVGLGLGLYISKTIVEQHGGAVGVESVPGTGSTFWFTLPLDPQADPAP